MPAKKRKPQKGGKTKRKTTRPGLGLVQNGDGFFGDAWNWTKGAAGSVNKFAKKTGAASTLMGLSPDPRMQAAAKIAKQAGYGKTQDSVAHNINKPSIRRLR